MNGPSYTYDASLRAARLPDAATGTTAQLIADAEATLMAVRKHIDPVVADSICGEIVWRMGGWAGPARRLRDYIDGVNRVLARLAPVEGEVAA